MIPSNIIDAGRKVAPFIHLLSFGERANEIDIVDASMPALPPHPIKILIPAPDFAFAKKMHFNSIDCYVFLVFLRSAVVLNLIRRICKNHVRKSRSYANET